MMTGAHREPLNIRRELSALRTGVAEHRNERQRLEASVAGINAQLASIDATMASLAAARDFEGVEQQRRNRAQAVERRAQAFASLRELDDRLRASIGNLGARLDPCDADPITPLLLLPVRLETRYTDDGSAVRVRIFPDDIHLDALDRGLTPVEQEAARRYWNAVWRASDEDSATAWRELQLNVGKDRAQWVAIGSEPTNLAARMSDSAPQFAAFTPATHRPTVARLLPDTFTVVARQGAVISIETGNPIAPEVVVGALSGDGRPPKQVGDAHVIEGAEWLVDYAEAVRIGMAVTLPLRSPRKKIDELFAFGVRRSLDPIRAAPAELTDLLLAHRCTEGLAFVPQGTPTNNTESARAGWQQRIEPRQPARDVLPAPAADSNATVLASALGIDSRTLAELEHAMQTDSALAGAMNVALWGPSWGNFLDRADTELTVNGRERLRAFHRDYVRGRGPLPAIRVGDQPYGVLPVTTLGDRWQTRDPFERELLVRLRRLREKWKACLASVPRIGAGDIDTTLKELLGSAPVSFAVRVRSVLAGALLPVATDVTGSSDADLVLEGLIEALIWEEINHASLQYPLGSLAAESRPLKLPYVDDSDPDFIAALLNDEPMSARSVLQALLELAWDAAQRAASSESGNGRFTEIVALSDRIDAQTQERVLALAVNAATASPAQLRQEAQQISHRLGVQRAAISQYQPIPAVKRSFGELAFAATSIEARNDLVVQAVGSWLDAQADRIELRDALQALRETSLDQRRILVAETLDTASHRLDAWLTAMVERRRVINRSRQSDSVTLGAYGWVEDLEPVGPRAAEGGYLHAPSLTHAATAGILRSAYLSHNPDGGGDGAFAVDLASARVRLALELVDGIRQGQPLAALLGYRIERALNESGAGRLIFSLRGIAPLTQGKLTDRNEALSQEALEAIAASNVVDGLDLVAKYQAKVAGFNAQKIRDLLDEKPASNPYLQNVAWPKVSEPEWASVTAAISSAAAAIDAVADLLLAEGVHQLVQGNISRAAAAMEAASSGDSVPPEPDFMVTPSVGVPVIHQLMIVANGGAPWNLARPRSAAEPRLEAWVGGRLGDPALVVVAQIGDARVMLSASGLCALDLVYDAAEWNVFEQRIRGALAAAGQPITDEIAFVDAPDPGWPAGLRSISDVFELAASIGTLLRRARPVGVEDLVLPSHTPSGTVPTVELQNAHVRASAAAGALAARGGALQTLIDAGVTDVPQLRAALDAVAAFGLAVPFVKDDRMPVVASLVAAEAARRSLEASEQLSTVSVQAVTQAGQTIFGDGFWILCGINSAGNDHWQTAFAGAPDGANAGAVLRFLTDQAAVRDGVRRLLEAHLLAQGVGVSATLGVGQMVGVNGSAPKRWIAVPLAAGEPTPTASVVNTVIASEGAFNTMSSFAGLVVDQWTEVLPLRERRGKEVDAPVDARHTSGIAFNADAPGARAPQALLLAVSPDGARWNVERVLEVLQETRELAKLRLVTIERTNGIARFLPALYEQSYSLQGEKAFNPLYLDKSLRIDAMATFLKDSS